MQTIIMITIVILIIYVLSLNLSYESFDTISYNAFEVPNIQVESLYSTETQTLKSLFDSLVINTDYKVFDENDLTTINPNISFPLEDSFKKAIINFLKDNLDSFRKDKVYILGKLINVKYKDVSNERIFIFNVTLVNPTNFFTRNIKIILKLSSIQDLVLPSDSSRYKDSIETFVDKYISIQKIVINTDQVLQLSVDGFDSLQPNLYRIKNKLHLTAPFLTSASDMIINKSMKDKFDIIVKEKALKKLTS